ncbi:MAG TPA: OmpA family protein [Gemmatimonadales bacterium]|nr:OmpA family protein [Gemmatimonadales bacterium]
MTRSRPVVGLVLLLAGPAAVSAQAHPITLPLPEGSVVVQTLTFTGGDRESFLSLQEVTDRGSRYGWQFREVQQTGDTIQEKYEFFEGMPDVLTSARLLSFHSQKGSPEHPGYTMMAISRATYRRLLAARSDTFQVMTLESPGGVAPAGLGWLGRGRTVPARYRGRLSLVGGGPAPFPLLVSGLRVEVPALHLRGDLTARGRRWTPELWVLADTTYPLLLKWVGASDAPENVLQTVRVDLPLDREAGDGPRGKGTGEPSLGGSGALEGALRSSCRVELPGIYFAFNSADLDPASDAAIAALAEVLGRHPDWTGTIEGHTDSVGTSAANLALSERRAAALRDRLVSAHKVAPARLDTKGFGSSRPRESNSTIEGRARNRRVELVRTCAGP